jgi:branched-chain amino acid transport system substrate-binding protein
MAKKTGFFIGIVLIILVIAAIITIFVFKVFDKKPVTIGAILPLTGPVAQSAIELRDGLNLAVEEVNLQGGINGQTVNLIIKDCKMDFEGAKNIFSNMEATAHPDLYVTMLSPIVITLAPLAEKNKVSLVSPLVTGSNKAILEGKKWVFRTCAPADIEVPTEINILKEKGIKNVGVIYQNDSLGQTVKGPFESEFSELGCTVLAEPFEPNAKDFKTQISNLLNTEAVYLIGLPAYLEPLIKQLRELKYNGLITSTSIAAQPSITALPEANGVYVAAQFCYNPNFNLANRVKEKFESKYKRPFNHEAGYAYDFIRLLAGLLDNRSVSRENIRKILEGGFTYSGLFGNLAIKKGSHDLSPPLYPAQIVNGELVFQ